MTDKAIEAAAKCYFEYEGGNWEEEPNEAFKDTYRRQARAAIAAYERAMWQPIESAPKDVGFSDFILLYCPEDKSTWLAKWQDESWFGVDELGLTRTGMGPDDVAGWEVTHWRPLPPTPDEDEK